MAEKVPLLSILFMALSGLAAVALPVLLLLYFRLRKKADLLPFFVGCAVMLLFALILESGVHQLVFALPAGKAIRDNVWLYALYGGLMAGLFEETGRFLAFRTALKKYRGKDVNALMYGAGHGGFEALVILGSVSLNNLLFSVLLNLGKTELLTAPLSGEALSQLEASFQTLRETPPWQFLMGPVERIAAAALQISLSVLVWFAVKKKGRGWLYPLAILLHALVDGATVLLASRLPLIAVEGVIYGMAFLIGLLARLIYRRCARGESTCSVMK